MPVTHTLIPNQLLAQDNISPITVNLTELSDGDSGTGMIVDPTDGILVCGMSDLVTQPINGSVFKLNVKSQVDTKSTIDIRVSYDGGTNYVQVANYIIAEDDDSSFEFATYNGSSESANTDQLNAEQVNNMQFTIGNGLGIIHDLNVTIDSGTGGKIQIQGGRVFLRQGRIRI
jgi:hypothetical protein